MHSVVCVNCFYFIYVEYFVLVACLRLACACLLFCWWYDTSHLGISLFPIGIVLWNCEEEKLTNFFLSELTISNQVIYLYFAISFGTQNINSIQDLLTQYSFRININPKDQRSQYSMYMMHHRDYQTTLDIL
jgi:hypothetical protein